MAAQQAQFAETIRAMKLALKRSADDTDSDSSIHAHTNRGNKLKRRAKFVREGRLDDTGGLAYKKRITHAGYTRNIIATKPTLYDEDGDVVSPVESDDEREVLPIHDDAFGEVHLERLLRPLTAASQLPDHPSLSWAYKSQALTQMTEQVLEMVRRERQCLWKAKRLLQRFRGDADWVPCEVFETEQDEMMLLLHESGEEVQSAAPSLFVDSRVPDVEMAVVEGESGDAVQLQVKAGVDEMDGVETLDMAAQQIVEEAKAEVEKRQAQTNGDGQSGDEPKENGEQINRDEQEPSDTSLPHPPFTSTEQDETAENDASEQASHSGKDANNAPSHSMTTRARARSPIPSPSPSPTPSDSASIPQINPWYSLPPTALPDRDLGLPATEAEESRRLLLLYVQKQEQIVRSLDTLYSGLQRADRSRKDVLRACKAEGHMRDDGKGTGNLVTEMSDGEDWYDVEEWGLGWSELKLLKNGTYGLEKGKDEAEDLEEEGRRVGGRRRRVARM